MYLVSPRDRKWSGTEDYRLPLVICSCSWECFMYQLFKGDTIIKLGFFDLYQKIQKLYKTQMNNYPETRFTVYRGKNESKSNGISSFCNKCSGNSLQNVHRYFYFIGIICGDWKHSWVWRWQLRDIAEILRKQISECEITKIGLKKYIYYCSEQITSKQETAAYDNQLGMVGQRKSDGENALDIEGKVLPPDDV